jgi:hypothetical protein
MLPAALGVRLSLPISSPSSPLRTKFPRKLNHRLVFGFVARATRSRRIIRDQVIAVPESRRLVAGFRSIDSWAYAGRTAAVAVLVVAAGVIQLNRKPAGPAAQTTAESVAPLLAEPFAETGSTLDQAEQSLGPLRAASLSNASPVDNSLRENLATLNAFIKECRKRLKEDPNDQMARDYLSAAYQQKSEILAAMMERGRSVN